MRWPVEAILDMLSAGMSTDEILYGHPELERNDILASLQYAKLLASGNTLEEIVG